MYTPERYTKKGRRFDDRPTPLAGKIILFLAGFCMAGMIGLLLTCSI
jgi:hypothetical protein